MGNNKSELIVSASRLRKWRINQDFEVLSKSYWDNEAEEYQSEEAFWDYTELERMRGNDVSELKLIIHEEIFEAKYGYFLADPVDFDNAKLCGFGVGRMLTGEKTGQTFLYPTKNFDIPLELFAYAVLALRRVDERIWNVVKHGVAANYFKIVVSPAVHDMVVENLTKKKGRMSTTTMSIIGDYNTESLLYDCKYLLI